MADIVVRAGIKKIDLKPYAVEKDEQGRLWPVGGCQLILTIGEIDNQDFWRLLRNQLHDDPITVEIWLTPQGAERIVPHA